MKIVQVTYTTQAGYVAQNQQNIKNMMADLHRLKPEGINYYTCVCADEKTFIHTAFFKSDEDQKILNGLTSFKTFQDQLKASGPEIPPKPEILTLIGSSNEMFNSK